MYGLTSNVPLPWYLADNLMLSKTRYLLNGTHAASAPALYSGTPLLTRN